jgi:hypothetical protein
MGYCSTLAKVDTGHVQKKDWSLRGESWSGCGVGVDAWIGSGLEALSVIPRVIQTPPLPPTLVVTIHHSVADLGGRASSAV